MVGTDTRFVSLDKYASFGKTKNMDSIHTMVKSVYWHPWLAGMNLLMCRLQDPLCQEHWSRRASQISSVDVCRVCEITFFQTVNGLCVVYSS